MSSVAVDAEMLSRDAKEEDGSKDAVLDDVEFKMKLMAESGGASGAPGGVAVLSGPPVGTGDALAKSELMATWPTGTPVEYGYAGTVGTARSLGKGGTAGTDGKTGTATVGTAGTAGTAGNGAEGSGCCATGATEGSFFVGAAAMAGAVGPFEAGDVTGGKVS
jgi:hypothetical protein